jgi:hypothetical protein
MTHPLVLAARSYLGVKYRHRGRNRLGIDCAGLVVLAYRDCGVETTNYVQYGRTPFQNGLVEHCTAIAGAALPTGAELQEGDVLLLRFNVDPHHMAIVSTVEYDGVSTSNIIHADGHVGRVIEQRLTPDMTARITHVFRKGVL